ncbi:MAG: hypothetical protein ACO3M5_06595 [Saprospiraceae bacterium]|jgi:hypothetical protein
MNLKLSLLKTAFMLGFALFFLIFCFMLLVLRPVPQAREHNVKEMTVQFDKVFEGPSNDIVFRIKGSDVYPYINRGLEKGLSVDRIRSKVLGEDLTIKLVKHWTPLDWSQRSPTLAYLEIEDSSIIVYNAIH